MIAIKIILLIGFLIFLPTLIYWLFWLLINTLALFTFALAALLDSVIGDWLRSKD